MKKKITLTNDFHNTSATIVPVPITDGRFKGLHKISRKTYLRVCHELCGINGCQCGGQFGHRAGHVAVVNEDYDRNLIIDINECYSAEYE